MEINKINNLLELFYRQYKKQNINNFFLHSLKDKNKKYTWQDTFENVIKLSSEISKYIKKGDRCLLISENRPEWMMTDLSIMLSEGITVPTYTTYSKRDYEYIIDDCTPSVIFISNIIQYEKIKDIIPKKSFIKKIFIFEDINQTNSDLYLNIIDIFKNNNSEIRNFLNLKIQRKDIACIIYTSGTEGNPKGVMLTHGGILNNCEGSFNLLKTIISKKTRFLTWLPLSHSYEHTVQFVQIAVGAEVYYAESIEKLIQNMNDCNPEIMTAVPRFYQNLYQKINSTFNKAKGLQKLLIDNTVKLGKKKLFRNKFYL